MKSNKGFTLVELLITVTILAIVIISAAAFMLTGSRSFAKGSADSGVQSEAELAVNQIEDLVIDVNGGVNYVVDDSADTESLVMYHVETDETSGLSVYKKRDVVWDRDKKKISNSEWIVKDDGSGTFVTDSTIYTNQLLAENVTAFNVDLSDVIKDTDKDGNEIDIVRSVVIRVDCVDGSGKASYATTPLITLRNRMMLSGDPDKIFTEIPTPDDTLALYISGSGMEGAVPIRDRVTTVERGKMYNLYAMVSASTNVNSLCDWELAGEDSGHNSNLNANGVFITLDVGAAEPNNYLIITAKYKDNPAKKAVGIVKVIGGTDKSLDSCKILPYDMKPYNPYYQGRAFTTNFSDEEKAELQFTWSVSDPSKVESFTEHNRDLTLKVIENEADMGKIFSITLRVYSPTTNQEVFDTIDYLIGGDSLLERGKRDDGQPNGYHRDNWYYFDLPDRGQGNKNFCEIVDYGIYVCDIHGNRISSKDYLIPYFLLNMNGGVMSPLNGGQRITYYLTIMEDMPPEEEFYIKVYIKFQFREDDTPWTYERIHFVSGVHLYGENATRGKANFYNDADVTFFYEVIGYYSLAWDNTPYVFDYDVVFDYDAPAGVTIEPKMNVPHTVVDGNKEGSKRIKGTVSYNVIDQFGRQGWEIYDKITIKSATIKVYMKQNPSIYTYCNITYQND